MFRRGCGRGWPAALGSLVSLESLNVAANDLSGPVPAELGSLALLEWLSLAGNDLSGPVPAELGSLPVLASLNVSGNDLSGLVPSSLGESASLQVLFLSGNRFAWPLPGGLASPRAGLYVSAPSSHEWAPAAPGALAASPRVDALELSWDPPAGGEPAVDRYELAWRRAGVGVGPLGAPGGPCGGGVL